MNTQKSLPFKGTLETKIDESSFLLLSRKVIKFLDIIIFIHLPNSETKAKITVRITDVDPPGVIKTSIVRTGTYSSDNLKNTSVGYHRASNKIYEKLLESAWYLYGTTQGNTQREICIIIIPNVMASYSFKEDGETSGMFFSPSLN